MEASPEGLAREAGWVPKEEGKPDSKWVNPKKPDKEYANPQEVCEGEGLK